MKKYISLSIALLTQTMAMDHSARYGVPGAQQPEWIPTSQDLSHSIPSFDEMISQINQPLIAEAHQVFFQRFIDISRLPILDSFKIDLYNFNSSCLMGYMNGTLPTLFQTALTLTQYPYYNLLAEIYNTYVGLRQLTQKATGPLFNPSVHFAAGAAAGSVPTESIEPQVGSNLASTDLDEEATDLDEGGAETQPTVSPAHHQPQKEPFFSQAQLDYIRNHPELTPEAIYNAFRTGKKKGLGFTDPQKRLGKCEKRMMGVQSKILELKR